MTYINLSRHDARLGGDLRLRLARHLQIVSTWGTTDLSLPYILSIYYQQLINANFVVIY
jgi:hypothetical protein